MKALFVILFILLLCRAVYAQSTLEYGTLLTRQAAAGANKEKGRQDSQEGDSIPQGADIVTSAVKRAYGDGAGAILRGSALLQQAGGGFGVADTSPAQAKQVVSDEPKVEPKVLEPETKESGLTKVYLKSGQVIEGKLVEQGDDRIKFESNGIVVTYFNEEIDKISR